MPQQAVITLRSETVRKAQVWLQSTTTDDNHALRDPVISPFFWGMQQEGYKHVTVPGGCVVLKQCPVCRGSYDGKFIKSGSVYWGCPQCDQIRQG